MKKLKEIIKSMFTDKDWDADLSKIVGFILIIISIVGFFKQLSEWQWLLGFGAGLIGWKSTVDGV